MLTDTQAKALDWGLTCLIEQTAERAPDLQPDQAVEEICDLASLAELLPLGEPRCRLMAYCEELRREHQVRVDALPRQVSLTEKDIAEFISELIDTHQATANSEFPPGHPDHIPHIVIPNAERSADIEVNSWTDDGEIILSLKDGTSFDICITRRA